MWNLVGNPKDRFSHDAAQLFHCFRCTVFISSQSVNNGETTKLLRDQPTVIFDFHNYFYPALEKYIHNKGPKPSFEVIVGFGQRFDLEKDPVSNLLISATLVHSYACNLHAMVYNILLFHTCHISLNIQNIMFLCHQNTAHGFRTCPKRRKASNLEKYTPKLS